MATTKIWPIKGDIAHVITYAENDAKTTLYADADTVSLKDLMDYAVRDDKTMRTTGAERQHFVSGVNCDPAIARQQMMMTKQRFGKTKGRVAYHGYQSFAPGEVTPEIAHEIGVKMARELWGDLYQVVVATHLDRDHLHNHFVLNSVSFVDGRKFRDDFSDYYAGMRAVSDRLCKEYGLSVVTEPKAKGMHYAEWQARKSGKHSVRGPIYEDIDRAIANSANMRQFIANMQGLGYVTKTNVKHWTVRPPGSEVNFRLDTLGRGYTQADIERRILGGKERDQKPPANATRRSEPKKAACRGNFNKPTTKLTGLRALYFYYLYKIGALPTKRPLRTRRSFFMRQEMRKLKTYTMQMALLCREKIDTLERLAVYKHNVDSLMSTLIDERETIRNRRKRYSNEETRSALGAEAAALSVHIKALRKDSRLCGDIAEQSKAMGQNLRAAVQKERDEHLTSKLGVTQKVR